MLAFEEGTANPFGIAAAQERGLLFIEPKDEVFKDMIIGVHQRPGDLPVNVCKTKQVRLRLLLGYFFTDLEWMVLVDKYESVG